MIRRRNRPRVLSLFTGAGGLDLGLEAAGFTTSLCVEVDSDARATLAHNRPDWKLANPGDINACRPEDLLAQAGLSSGQVDLLAGGPPCQPFSKSSYWVRGDTRRLQDPRASTLNAYLRVVEVGLPKVVLLENVGGLTFDGKDEGLTLLERGLAHINRLKRSKYNLNVLHINAADFGVPQHRERVILIASREGHAFKMPVPTHGTEPQLEPFRTSWDAIGDLDSGNCPAELSPSGKWARLLPSIPEGLNYLWHTPQKEGLPLFGWRTKFWSFLLKLAKARPSWTIQAEPGPATGPFHWKSRLLSVRELCRLQTIPDTYAILGDRRTAQRQIGNAVPSALAELIGLEIRRQLLGDSRIPRELTLVQTRRLPCPPPERRRPVAPEYLPLRGNHRAHRGTGLGPSARKRAVRRNGREVTLKRA